ncbi:MAG TPA: hypothetical protein ENI76_01850, partial [Ignavibacteria bacterium]|nr:hypothetical protein [Ignavibacteria bacterium]
MNTIKLKYKKDRKVFVPDREVDLPDNFEVELPGVKESTPIDKEKIIKEIEEEGRKYFPDFKSNPQVKELLGLLRTSEFSKFSDEELKAIYHENAWRSSDEKYNRVFISSKKMP